MVSSPVGCSTERTHRHTAKRSDTAQTGSPQKTSTTVDKGIVDLSIEGGEVTETNGGRKVGTQIKRVKNWVE